MNSVAHGPDHPRDANPLSEEQILDWIEGRLSAADEATLAKAATRPGLDARVRQMQANRRALASLMDEPAPAELCERVLAALERDALIGLTKGESGAIPVSSVPGPSDGPGVIARIMNMSPARFAMAAGLLLAAGAAVYLGLIANRGGTNPKPADVSPVGPLAIKTDGAESAVPLAVAPGDPAPMVAAEGVGPESLATQILASAAPMDMARAVEAARAGRLVVRVIASDTDGLARIEAASARDAGVRDWRLTRDVPAAVVAGVMPTKTSPGRAVRTEAALAYAADPLRLIGPGAALAWTSPPTVDRASRVRATYLVDVPASSDMLQIVKTLFAGATSATVVFEELDEPLETPRRVEPEDVLWWTQSTARWIPRVSIPVVVEER